MERMCKYLFLWKIDACKLYKASPIKCFHYAILQTPPSPALPQVDFIIQEATSVDHLCELYEGWTPWV